ncbi:hypothetical protein PQX77_016072 [Marasmius sp. AFHP31]|nr:hypothetical protein PQX77_016072 [Marasmius sp. AFHP31]
MPPLGFIPKLPLRLRPQMPSSLNIADPKCDEFSILDPFIISLLSKLFLHIPHPERKKLVSSDRVAQWIIPLRQLHYATPEFSSLFNLYHGLMDTLPNMAEWIEDPPSEPRYVGFAYSGTDKLLFTFPFFYNLPVSRPASFSPSSSPNQSLPFDSPPDLAVTIHRRDPVLTWDEILAVLLMHHRDHNTNISSFVPERYRTETPPMTPSHFLSYTLPFEIRFRNTHGLLHHISTGLPVATKYAPQIFRIGILRLVTIYGWATVSLFKAPFLNTHVQRVMETWFPDGDLIAEYFLKYPSSIRLPTFGYRNFGSKFEAPPSVGGLCPPHVDNLDLPLLIRQPSYPPAFRYSFSDTNIPFTSINFLHFAPPLRSSDIDVLLHP